LLDSLLQEIVENDGRMSKTYDCGNAEYRGENVSGERN